VLVKGVLAGEVEIEAAKARSGKIPVILRLIEDAPYTGVQKRLTTALTSPAQPPSCKQNNPGPSLISTCNWVSASTLKPAESN